MIFFSQTKICFLKISSDLDQKSVQEANHAYCTNIPQQLLVPEEFGMPKQIQVISTFNGQIHL